MTTAETDLTKEIINGFPTIPFSAAKEYRERAIDNLRATGLPEKKNEEYRFTPATAIFQKNFAWSTKNASGEANSGDDYYIPGLPVHRVVFVNGHFSEKYSSATNDKDCLQVIRLADAFKNNQTLLKFFFEKSAASKDAFELINTAFWQDGVFIHVPPGVAIEKPIHILHVNDVTPENVITHTKLIVIVEPGSKLTLLESFHSHGEHAAFHTLSEHIEVQENANLHYCKIQNDPALYQVANTHIHQTNSSRVDTFTLTLDGKMVRNNFSIAVDGENCESHFHGLYLLKGNTLADNHTVVDHQKPNSFSNEMYKGILAENAKGVFNGKIFVRPHAQKTNAFQSNRNILLDDTATINTKPQLEIWADDVKCSHGCTTGQLDEEAMFYLRSRGIPEKEARALLLHAFASETYANIENETLKNFLEKLISARLAIE